MDLKPLLKTVKEVQVVEGLGLVLFLTNGNKISVVGDNDGSMYYYLYDEKDRCLGMLFE